MTVTDLAADLAAALRPALGTGVTVDGLVREPGGASRETWSFWARLTDGSARRLILRRDPVDTPGSGLRLEGSLLRAAHRAGVPVPLIVAAGDDTAALGPGALVLEFVDGETIPRRILRDPALAEIRPRLAARCGEVLAAIHRIPRAEVPGLPGGDPLEQMRATVDRLGQPHPAFELAFRWLGDHRPPRAVPVVVHGDFRNGNLIVGPDGIRAVLDWELAHSGDPVEDLAWLCVKAWRFGAEAPVGGFGSVDELVAAYEGAGGTAVDRAALRWWEVLGTLRWGVICLVQTVTHLSGLYRSVELAAIGRRVCEVEWDLLDLLGLLETAPGPGPGDTSGATGPDATGAVPTLHDVPSAAELLDAVEEFLRTDVADATSGRVRFHSRVAANVVALVRRQLTAGAKPEADHRAQLARLGVADDAELADAIRAGRLDERGDEVAGAVAAAVAAKLFVAHPGYR